MGWISLTTASSDLGLVGLGSHTLFWSLRVVLLPKTSLLARSKPSKLISRVFESSHGLAACLPLTLLHLPPTLESDQPNDGQRQCKHLAHPTHCTPELTSRSPLQPPIVLLLFPTTCS